MCYSALLNQNIRKLKARYGADPDYKNLEEMFFRRAQGEAIPISEAFEAQFLTPQNPDESRIKEIIENFRAQRIFELERTKFNQQERLATNERKFSIKATKAAANEIRVATNKIKDAEMKIDRLKSSNAESTHGRIFPMQFTPIIANLDGKRKIVLSRFHCRPNGLPPTVDKKYPGIYNAREDNLKGNLWSQLFGKTHAIMEGTRFYERVTKHDYEKRALRKDEIEQTMELEFRPQEESNLIFPCLFSYWGTPSKDGFYSAAAITGEPNPEVQETGHDRTIKTLKQKYFESWLCPDTHQEETLLHFLSDKELHYFNHNIVRKED